MIDIFSDQNDLRVVVARLANGGMTIQRIADFLQTDYWSVYSLIRKIENDFDGVIKIRRGRREVVVRLNLPPRQGRPLRKEKLETAKRLLMKTNLPLSEIARRSGLRSRSAVYKVRDELQRKSERAAGSFQPRRENRVCKVHGPVTIWPCVACAAEKARERRAVVIQK